ncbi:caspase family protein [Streptomyces sp. NL15-2K]|uniref:vWA domain-containing protein n=1 Tax=Streptomyces sp. NL15-2K TaxID=376149 RepID=UPI000F559C9F|nr:MULTISPECIES: caspase family protein [Actinomycetes]WKX06278.1 substrate-binding domain-containing protein [Kutzneria buriramensis]GCB52861.1 hypothetical protein SNL152K_10218 [Streptomyces sp. NL15-2K]
MTGFDPRGLVNRALLVGVSEYDLTEPPHGVPGDLPAVKHNVNRLRDVLQRGRVFGEHEITVSRSPSLDDFSRALRTAAGEAEGLLLLYFAGHGAIPSAGDELFLQMRNASVVAGGHAVFPGAEMFTTVLTVLATSPARRIVVILDCCFAGNAAWLWETFRDKRRVLLLMSVQANHRTDAGDPRTPTPFTEELLRLLDTDEEAWFQDLADRQRERMAAAGHRTVRGEPWEPQSRTEPTEDVLLAARAARPAGGGPKDTAEPLVPVAPDGGEQPRTAARRAVRTPIGHAWAAPSALLHTCVEAVGARLRRTRRLGLVRPGQRPRRRATAPAVLLVLATLGLGSYGVVVLVGDDSSCAPPLELRVLTDPDLEPTVRAAADAYLTSEENTTGEGCRRSGLTVYSAGAADVVRALRKQSASWQEPPDERTNPQRDVGPQPDIWIPASRADVARVTAWQDTDAVATLDPEDAPLAYSPVVLAVPQDLAARSRSERVGPALIPMIDALRERHENAEVHRPDPEFTDTGLLASIGLYGSGALAPGRAEQRIAPGPPSPTATELLCTLPDDEAVDKRAAALVPEFLMKSGVGCDSTRREPRVAQYPGNVPGLEPVFVRVRWQGAERDVAARDRAADGFRTWLADRAGREVFARAGFRETSGSGSRSLLDTSDIAPGVLPAPDGLVEPAGRDAMERALTRYRGAHGPGRVLFLLDTSGSMADLWQGPSGGPGLLKQSLGGLGDDDEYAVWAVSGTGDRPPYATLLPFGHHARRDAEQVIDRNARVRDAEADPRAALLAALEEMERRGAGDERPQLIVYITDDEDAGRLTGGDLNSVLARARSAQVPVTMVSLTGDGCDEDKPDTAISEASGGRCVDADEDLGSALHDEVARTGTGED